MNEQVTFFGAETRWFSWRQVLKIRAGTNCSRGKVLERESFPNRGIPKKKHPFTPSAERNAGYKGGAGIASLTQ
jgi:hypothetical protein